MDQHTSSPIDQPAETQLGKRTLWQRLVEPSSEVATLETRRQVQLLSSLLVVLVPIFTVGTIIIPLSDMAQLPIALALGIIVISLATAYGLSRSKHHRIGVYLALACLVLVLPIGLLAADVYNAQIITSAFIWSIIPVLLGSVLVSSRGMMVVAGANILILLSLPVLISEVGVRDISQMLVYIVLTSALTIVTVRHRDRLEEEQRVEMQGNNRELEAIRGSLEERNTQLQTTITQYDDYMAEVVHGNLAARLSLDTETHEASDPLIGLGNRLNETAASLQSMILQIRNAADNLSAASAEILSATTQQASGASEQSAAIAQTTTTVDQLKTIAEQSVVRAQEVTGVSQRTLQVSRTGHLAVQDTISSMAQIRVRVESIAENILALSEQTQQVGDIIATVNDIAAQSNILALNASVEAARAGEYGKGFAVVAVEVRNLAEQSRQATAQVRAILSDIQQATNTTVMATEEGTKGVDEGMRLASQAGEAIDQLADVIEESSQAATQMVAGGRQQAAGVEQVALAMQNINQATAQSLASTRQAEGAARELNDLARSLIEIVERYRV